ncbi:MAG: hypothetical protein KAT69_09195 [Candidatus Aminicenantes bacterium]|nr:hypothetical protein [Candidatus Aminicenantes bacterium]
MKIIEIKSDEILYDSKGKEKFYVTPEFWQALKSGKIQYMSGGMKEGIRYSEILSLNLKARNFDSIFKRIAESAIGKEVMEGRMPIDTRL